MVIVRGFVTSFADVVEFWETWRPYVAQPPTVLPAAWRELPWHIEQRGDVGWCSVVLNR